MHRKTTARRGRHFAGKPSAGVSESGSESGSESEHDGASEELSHSKGMVLHLGDLTVKEEAPESVKLETRIKEEQDDVKQEQEDVKQEHSSEEEEEEEEDSTSSSDGSDSDSDSNSDSDTDQLLLVKPSYVPKTKRSATSNTYDAAQSTFSPAARKDQTLKMVESTIRQEKLASMVSKHKTTSLGDNEVLQIDDTDNIDAEAEYEAWKARERFRMRRERQEIEREEREREEQEELRTMTEEERVQLHAKRLEERKKELQKDESMAAKPSANSHHYHKGAFYQDDDLIVKRDFSEALEDGYKNIRDVPQPLRQLNKIGQKGQLRHPSAYEQDTTIQSDKRTKRPRKI